MIEEPPLLTIRPPKRRPTPAQIAAFRDVPTGFVCDAMDGRGALSPAIAPLGGGRDIDCRAAGPALTALNRPSDILGTLAALDHVQPGDIVVAAFGGFQGCAALGDIVTGMLRNAGAAGVVTDGPMRDYSGLVRVGLPAWCTGLNPNSPFTTGPAEVGGPVEIGGQPVETGDMIVADRDGVVVVPFARIDAVIARLAEVRRLEAETEAKVAAGARQLVDIAAMIADGRAVVLD